MTFILKFLRMKLLMSKVEGTVLEGFSFRVPLFSALPKIHKNPWNIRPIVPCFNVLQGPASEYLHVALQQFYAEYDTILVNSRDLLIKVEEFNRSELRSIPKGYK